MTLDECLERFGWPPTAESVVEIRGLLQREAAVERAAQGGGDTELMRLLCALLFATGDVRQAVLIWRAKTASMDAPYHSSRLQVFAFSLPRHSDPSGSLPEPEFTHRFW